jgi:hypothetical protein
LPQAATAASNEHCFGIHFIQFPFLIIILNITTYFYPSRYGLATALVRDSPRKLVAQAFSVF